MMASNQTFIIAAYVATWVALLGYMGYLLRRGARARADYERLAPPSEGIQP